MTPFLLVLAFCGTNALVSAGATAIHKCDQELISKLKQEWGDNAPTGLLKEGKENGLEVVIKSTKGFYTTYTKCSQSLFIGNSLVMIDVNKKGEPTTSIAPVAESDGTLCNPKTGTKRFFVHKGDRVYGVYICKDDGPEGKPQGFIKVKKCGYNKADVTLAENSLKKLGLEMKESYDEKCN